MKKAYILLFFSCLGYAFGPPAYMKVVSTGLPPDIIVGYFLLIGGASIMLARHVGQKPRSVRYNTSMILATIAVGIMWPLYFLGYIYAMMQSSIAEATLLTRFTPLMVVILSIWLLSDKVTSWTGILSAVTLCVIGVTVVQSHDFSSGVELTFFTPVVMIMLATCFIGALSEVLRASMSKEIHSSDIVSKSMVVGGAAVFCYKLLWGKNIGKCVWPSIFLDSAISFIRACLSQNNLAISSVTDFTLLRASSRSKLLFSFVPVFITAPVLWFKYKNLSISICKEQIAQIVSML